VVDTHDVMWRRHLAFSHAGLVSDLAIDARAEGAQLAKFDSVIAIQGADAAVLREMLGATPVHVVHHPSPIEPLPAADRAPLEVAFVASGMSSNVDGMRQFAQEIWPLVQSDVRQAARVAVYGGVCNKLAAEALPADVELRGFADDLRAVYRDSAVIINPVNAGGGLKIKTVEALCYGRCLVTTPSGAEGLEDGAGTAFLMAHTSAEFAALLEHALRERDFREGIARGANDYARTHFARDVVRDSLARAVLGR
jgi:glycosyltransferase involved in cell wall biosynthesis